jgi:hypothetical protein
VKKSKTLPAKQKAATNFTKSTNGRTDHGAPGVCAALLPPPAPRCAQQPSGSRPDGKRHRQAHVDIGRRMRLPAGRESEGWPQAAGGGSRAAQIFPRFVPFVKFVAVFAFASSSQRSPRSPRRGLYAHHNRRKRCLNHRCPHGLVSEEGGARTLARTIFLLKEPSPRAYNFCGPRGND